MTGLSRIIRTQPAAGRLRRLLVRDLVLLAEIGVYRHERGRQQRVCINLDLAVEDDAPLHRDRLVDVVDYADIAERVRRLVEGERVNLVETLAERIAALCFADRRVRTARVRVEKLDAMPDVAAVGVEIERDSPDF